MTHHDHHHHPPHRHHDGRPEHGRHVAWWILLGIVLTLLAILGWSWPEMFGVPPDPLTQ